MQKRMEDRQEAEASINMEAQLIALKRKAASWGANEDEESITGFQGGRWEALSNWFPATVVWSGKQYPSVEHAFQAAKAAAEPEQAEAIRKAASPKEAHALGQALSLPPTWERQRLKLMETLLRDKFRRDSALRERLLRTENKNLIANNKWGEAFWGVSGGNGGNNLGKLLMNLRDEARAGDDVDAWLRSSFEVAAVGPDLDPISLEQTRKGEPIKPDLTLGAAALYFVGKHSACAVQLEHPSLSRRHAVLLRDKVRGLLVVDLASKAPRACGCAALLGSNHSAPTPLPAAWLGWLALGGAPRSGASGHAAPGPVRGWGTDSRLGPRSRMLRLATPGGHDAQQEAAATVHGHPAQGRRRARLRRLVAHAHAAHPPARRAAAPRGAARRAHRAARRAREGGGRPGTTARTLEAAPGRDSPRGHPPLHGPVHLLRAALWVREERSRRSDAEEKPRLRARAGPSCWPVGAHFTAFGPTQASLFGLLPQAKRLDPNQRTLFVGNLPYDATEDDVREALEALGCAATSGVRLPLDKETNQPRGFAFVEFEQVAASLGN